MENNIPYAALELMNARHDRTMKRMCIAFVVAFCVLAITNCVMFCFWCNQVKENSDKNTEQIVSYIEEVHNEQNRS